MLDKAKNTVIRGFDDAKKSPRFLGGGRFRSSGLTEDGIGTDSTTTGTWASLATSVSHAGLLTEGCLLFSLNSDFIPGGLDESNVEIAAVNAATNPATLFNRDAVKGQIIIQADNAIDSQLRIAPADVEYQHLNMLACHAGKGDYIPLVHQWSSTGKFQTLFDGLPIAESEIGTYDWGGEDMTPFDVRDPAAATDPLAVRDCALLSQFQDQGSGRISVGFLGDSLMNFGGFPDWLWKTRTEQRPEWVPLENAFMTAGPKGIDGADGAATESINGKHYDAGCLTTIVRELHKSGRLTSNNLNFTQGGATASQIKTNATNMLTIGIPDVVFINAGQNDANDGASFNASAQAAFRSDLQSILQSLKNAGVSQVVISNLHSMQNNSAFSDQVYADNVDICNAIIDRLPGWGRSHGLGIDYVVVADNFTAFGGHNPNTSLFITDDVHHQTGGSYLFGATMANALFAKLNATVGGGSSLRRKGRLVLGEGFRPINTRTTYQEPKESPMRIRIGRKIKIGK